MSMESEVRYRHARVEDLPAIRKIFERVSTIEQTDSYYAKLQRAIQNRAFPGEAGRCSVIVAVTRTQPKTIAGAVLVQTFNIIGARDTGQIPFDFLDAPRTDYEVLIVSGVGVLPEYRRHGIGTELVQTGIRSLAADPRVQAVLIYSPSNSQLAEEFFDSLHFERFGQLPQAFSKADGTHVPATVWLTVLHGEPIEYVNPKPEILLDLSSPHLSGLRRKHLPKWARDLLVQFVLPFGIVALLFFLSFILVTLGPLKGISDKDWFNKVGGNTGAPSIEPVAHVHQFDSPDEYEEF